MWRIHGVAQYLSQIFSEVRWGLVSKASAEAEVGQPVDMVFPNCRTTSLRAENTNHKVVNRNSYLKSPAIFQKNAALWTVAKWPKRWHGEYPVDQLNYSIPIGNPHGFGGWMPHRRRVYPRDVSWFLMTLHIKIWRCMNDYDIADVLIILTMSLTRNLIRSNFSTLLPLPDVFDGRDGHDQDTLHGWGPRKHQRKRQWRPRMRWYEAGVAAGVTGPKFSGHFGSLRVIHFDSTCHGSPPSKLCRIGRWIFSKQKLKELKLGWLLVKYGSVSFKTGQHEHQFMPGPQCGSWGTNIVADAGAINRARGGFRCSSATASWNPIKLTWPMAKL